jgi:hypothetical protein
MRLQKGKAVRRMGFFEHTGCYWARADPAEGALPAAGVEVRGAPRSLGGTAHWAPGNHIMTPSSRSYAELHEGRTAAGRR